MHTRVSAVTIFQLREKNCGYKLKFLTFSLDLKHIRNFPQINIHSISQDLGISILLIQELNPPRYELTTDLWIDFHVGNGLLHRCQIQTRALSQSWGSLPEVAQMAAVGLWWRGRRCMWWRSWRSWNSQWRGVSIAERCCRELCSPLSSHPLLNSARRHCRAPSQGAPSQGPPVVDDGPPYRLPTSLCRPREALALAAARRCLLPLRLADGDPPPTWRTWTSRIERRWKFSVGDSGSWREIGRGKAGGGGGTENRARRSSQEIPSSVMKWNSTGSVGISSGFIAWVLVPAGFHPDETPFLSLLIDSSPTQ